MIRGLMKWMSFGLALWLILGVRAEPAEASHYRLSELDAFEEWQLEALASQGIDTTEQFLQRTLTPENRVELSRATEISELEILVFARLCELLQIEGVGPRAAQLLRAAGVVSADDLASRSPAELAERCGAVNAVEQLTGINPTEENLVEWIELAAAVPYRVEPAAERLEPEPDSEPSQPAGP